MFCYPGKNYKKQKINKINDKIRICDQCSLSSVRVNAICGEGDLNARLFFIAQAPGEVEDQENKMFIGPTGKVIDELFREAHIKRDEIYMTNLIKCKLPKNLKPKQNEIEQCSQYLIQEIAIVNPKFLIPMGYYAAKFVFNHYCIEDNLPSDSAGKLFFCKNIKIYSLKHPSSIIYNPAFMQTMKQHFKKLTILMKNCKWYPVCPMKWFYEQGKLNKKWIEMYCKGDWKSCVRYQMEESDKYHPDNMLPDGTICNDLI